MSEAATTTAEAVPVEGATDARLLRVFGGRLAGAEQMLAIGATVRIGHGFDHELVLRGKGTDGCSLTLHVGAAGVRVQVAGGTVRLLGCTIEPGQSALLPPFVPLQVGDHAIAVGEADSPRWAEVPMLLADAASGLDDDDADPMPGAPASSPPASLPHGVGRWLGREAGAVGRRFDLPARRPALFLGAAAALVLAIAVPATIREVKATVSGPRAVDARLAEGGFAALGVRVDPASDALVVEGRVADDRAVERVRALLGDDFGAVRLNLTTTAAAAEALNGLLQGEGIDAEARAGADGVTVHTEYLPGDRLAALRQRILADLPDTGPLRFVRDPGRGAKDLQYFFASDRFGLASLVDGDPGHIVTADGQYWFAGATLPTGHRLLSIANGTVRFERDGLVETLHVAPSAAAPPTDEQPTQASPPADLASQSTTNTTNLPTRAKWAGRTQP